jgi:hypothetical protein
MLPVIFDIPGELPADCGIFQSIDGGAITFDCFVGKLDQLYQHSRQFAVIANAGIDLTIAR